MALRRHLIWCLLPVIALAYNVPQIDYEPDDSPAINNNQVSSVPPSYPGPTAGRPVHTGPTPPRSPNGGYWWNGPNNPFDRPPPGTVVKGEGAAPQARPPPQQNYRPPPQQNYRPPPQQNYRPPAGNPSSGSPGCGGSYTGGCGGSSGAPPPPPSSSGECPPGRPGCGVIPPDESFGGSSIEGTHGGVQPARPSGGSQSASGSSGPPSPGGYPTDPAWASSKPPGGYPKDPLWASQPKPTGCQPGVKCNGGPTRPPIAVIPQRPPSYPRCNNGLQCVQYHQCQNGQISNGGGLPIDVRAISKQELEQYGPVCGNINVCCAPAQPNPSQPLPSNGGENYGGPVPSPVQVLPVPVQPIQPPARPPTTGSYGGSTSTGGEYYGGSASSPVPVQPIQPPARPPTTGNYGGSASSPVPVRPVQPPASGGSPSYGGVPPEPIELPSSGNYGGGPSYGGSPSGNYGGSTSGNYGGSGPSPGPVRPVTPPNYSGSGVAAGSQQRPPPQSGGNAGCGYGNNCGNQQPANNCGYGNYGSGCNNGAGAGQPQQPPPYNPQGSGSINRPVRPPCNSPGQPGCGNGGGSGSQQQRPPPYNPQGSGGNGNPNGPYTGPFAEDVPPPPGCAAALKCVPEDYCDANGVMIPNPIRLTPTQVLYRVALSTCTNVETNQVGFCCRDPNYKDPWPDNIPPPPGQHTKH